MNRKGYELEDRLVGMGALACRVAMELPTSGVGKHISSQLFRCSTSPAANYAEACGSESRRDFIHKLKICVKELRETLVWLKFVKALEMEGKAPVEGAIRETDEHSHRPPQPEARRALAMTYFAFHNSTNPRLQ